MIDIYIEENMQKLSNTQQAYHYLKQLILNCDLLPGQMIYEKDLYSTLDWGRTPIHEALLLLRNDGLIEIFPRKGMQVTDYTAQSINNIFQIRKLLEPTVASEFKQMYSKEILLDYYDKFSCAEKYTNREYYTLDIQFHRYLLEVTQNEKLLQIWDEIMMHQYRLCLFTAQKNTSFRPESDSQHNNVIKALIQEDTPAIVSSLTEHINRSLLSSLTAIRVS